MKTSEMIKKAAMKIVIKVGDVVELARRFRSSPAQAMQQVVEQVRAGVKDTLESVMDAEIGLFLGEESQKGNKRNGYVRRTYTIRNLGTLELRVPRDRKGEFCSTVVPPNRRYDEAIEKDLALLNLAGLSTRSLSMMSRQLLGIAVSAQEVSNALERIVPAARAFLQRPLDGRKFVYLYVDGTNFSVRRSTVDKEPTLVVLGVDEHGRKSILAMEQGDRDNRRAWEAVFAEMKHRGLDPFPVRLGIMDGLAGLADAFREAFPNARVARCWVHKARNVFPRVPKRYQAGFKHSWDAVQYAKSKQDAQEAFELLRNTWGKTASDAVASMERDIEALLEHYEFPKEHWPSLRTTNPIERVNKEFKRRSKPMETLGPDALKTLLAFTALRLEFGWTFAPIQSHNAENIKRLLKHQEIANASEILLN
jgi:putative transposase